jgi:hypothetical protein
MAHKKIKAFIKSINSMGACYVFVADVNGCLCVTTRKQKIREKINCLMEERVQVVIPEIESWYLAGLDTSACDCLGCCALTTTDGVTKEKFNDIVPSNFATRTDFLLEILNRFCLVTASQKNGSFRYFLEKHIHCQLP